MGTISIIDTGYIKSDKSGTQLDTTDNTLVVNNGTAITLKTASLKYSGGVSLDNNPQPGTYQNTELNFVSFDNEMIVIRGIVRRDVNSDMDILKYLNQMRKTKGIKLIYYTDKDDGYRDLTDSLGTTGVFNSSSPNAGEIGSDIPYIPVRIKGFDVKQKDGIKLEFQMTGEQDI